MLAGYAGEMTARLVSARNTSLRHWISPSPEDHGSVVAAFAGEEARLPGATITVTLRRASLAAKARAVGRC